MRDVVTIILITILLIFIITNLIIFLLFSTGHNSGEPYNTWNGERYNAWDNINKNVEDKNIPTEAELKEHYPKEIPIIDEKVEIVVNTVKEFTVTGTNYKFEPSLMTVNKGDTVKITFKDINGFHDFKIDEFNVATQKLNTGNEQTVTFVADKTGSFEYYCSIGSHRSMGMKGTLVVK